MPAHPCVSREMSSGLAYRLLEHVRGLRGGLEGFNESKLGVTMARTSHEHRAQSSKEEEATRSTQQAIHQLATNDLIVSPFGMWSAFMGDMDRMVRGFGLAPLLFRTESGAASARQARSNDSANTAPTWSPPFEVLTRDGQFVVRAEIPGIDKEHVKVEIDEDRAVISGEREEEREDKRGDSYRTERSYGRFSLVVPLPEGANADQARAMSADGVLEIVIPMAGSEPKAHRLEIRELSAAERGNGGEQKAEQRSRSPKRRQPRAPRQRKRGGASARRAH